MPRQPPHRCNDCEALLSKHYPYDYCPRCWQNRFDAPPGKCRINYFEAAANPALYPRERPIKSVQSIQGSAIAAARDA